MGLKLSNRKYDLVLEDSIPGRCVPPEWHLPLWSPGPGENRPGVDRVVLQRAQTGKTEGKGSRDRWSSAMELSGKVSSEQENTAMSVQTGG